MGNVAQFSKANWGVDEIAQYDLAGFHVTGKKVFDALSEKRLAKARITFTRARIVSLKSRVKAILVPLLPLSLFVLLPSGQCSIDIFLLAFFRSAANKDHKPVTIFSEVNPVAGTKINPVLINTRSEEH